LLRQVPHADRSWPDGLLAENPYLFGGGVKAAVAIAPVRVLKPKEAHMGP
jgi:hypothetical protein